MMELSSGYMLSLQDTGNHQHSAATPIGSEPIRDKRDEGNNPDAKGID